jgi:hypothetical protein
MEYCFPTRNSLRRLGGWLGWVSLILPTSFSAATFTVTTTAGAGPDSLR